MKIKVSHGYIEKQLLSHPFYPSILSVSDVLEQLGLSVQVGRTQMEQLPNIPYPYLLHTKANQGGLLLINNEQVLSKHLEKLKTGGGVILKAENKEGIFNPSHKVAFQKEILKKWSKYIALLSAGTLLLLSYLSNVGLENSVFLLAALAGLTLGYVLTAKDLGVKYAAVESYCGAGAANNCDKVLTSEYSKLFGAVTFSDVVITYFATQTIIAGFIIPFSGLSAAWCSVLGGMAALSIPAILFSVYYQWAKIQAWCRLCLLVVGVLTLQIGFFSYAVQNGLFTPVNPGNVVLGVTLLLFAGIGSAVIWLKELIKSEQQAIHAETISNRVKYDPEIFTHYLMEQRKVDVTPFENEISIGDLKAPIRLVMASNLLCNPCKMMHKRLAELVAIYPSKVCVAVRFLPLRKPKKNTEDYLDPREYLITYLSDNITGKDEASHRTESIINDWFDTNDLHNFTEKHPINMDVFESSIIKELISLHDNWVKLANITHTPTLFINGYEIPDNYSIENLKAMIPGLVETLPKLDEI